MGASEREQRRRRSNSAAETEAVGAEVAAGLSPGDVALVVGEVGAGKTTLIRGACRALGVDGPVTSPTFTIGRRFRGADGIWVSHLDLYRLAGIDSEEPALLDDYLRADSIAFVEWPAAGGTRLRRSALEIRLEHAGGETREIEIRPASTRP
jgi:tRNA threonylcarbamoyladenosine biosynthesis protein TsaE